MKTNHMLNVLHLHEQEFMRITAAVGAAEKKTSGEIAVVLTAESAHYAFWELLAAVSTAAVVFAVLLPCAGAITAAYERMVWAPRVWVVPALYGVICFAVTIAAFYLWNIAPLDRLIIPHRVQQASVTRCAFRTFAETGVHNTREHSGILIFVSYLERQVRIIADSGIAQKISQDLWNIIADDLAAEIRAHNAAEGFIAAIEKCGALLNEHFPIQRDDVNELADGLIILEGTEWY
ncbi:MAG: TPM domain-containing protein [Treponema sp.]|nr:TPM domain-containing protein [Treponema sp.]